MPATVISVARGSAAQAAGVQPGDILLSVGGHTVLDVLDYKFYSYDSSPQITLRRGERELTVRLDKCEGEDAGMEFETYLMDSQKGCSNRCVFCFIDQLPRGMRDTLYFKDDDARLSFLLGNYITMTNLSDADARRIIDMRISPLNISVHAIDPDVRSLMLGTKRGGDSLRHLRSFTEAGIAINAQIVVCPGINDGQALRDTLNALISMHPSVRSVAIVPVGLTRHRDTLYPLKTVTQNAARAIIALVDEARQTARDKTGDALCYAADEFYVKAGQGLPPDEYYGEFHQLENGVGLMRLFELELRAALSSPDDFPAPSPVTIITGAAARPFIDSMVDLMRQKCHNLHCDVFTVHNDFFGQCVDVAGLLCGQDIISQLRGKINTARLLIPDVMLRHGETVFLDDITVVQVARSLAAEIEVVPVDGGAFCDAVFGL